MEFYLDGKAIPEYYPLLNAMPDRKFYNATRTRHSVAVAAAPTPAPDKIGPQFGFSPHFSLWRDAIPLMRLVGGHRIRLHAVNWSQIEPERGKYEWSELDDLLKCAADNGFTGEDIVFNVMKTPKWASSKPEDDKYRVCMYGYETYAPVNLDDWINFLRTLQKRYPQVKTYELWNEPHLRGFSVFWNDTVENFTKMQSAGFRALKTGDSGTEVWLGGIGERYLSFYKELSATPGGRDYDVLPMHGSWLTSDIFRDFDRSCGFTSKPWVSSEWHAMLMRPMQGRYPGERELARTMLLDFLNQIRGGAREVYMFCVLNLQFSERECLAVLKKNQKNVTHVSGLFRRAPYIQPRYQAMAWHNFTTTVKGKLKLISQQVLPGGICAVELEDEGGKLLVFWNPAKSTVPAGNGLAAATGGRAVMPDGSPVEISDSALLKPELYYLSRPVAPLQGGETGEVIRKPVSVRGLDHGTIGNYTADDTTEKVWNKLESGEKTEGNDFNARFAVKRTAGMIELSVEVTEKHHAAECNIVWAIDTTGKGDDQKLLRFTCDSKNIIKSKAPDVGGDLPGNYSQEGERVKYGSVSFKRSRGVSYYNIKIDNSEFFPLSTDLHLRMSLQVNNGGKSLDWGGGLRGVADPAKFGDLFVRATRRQLLNSSNLQYPGWKKDYELTLKDTTLRIKNINRSQCVGANTNRFALTPGMGYQISFEGRGQANLSVAALGKFGRINLSETLLDSRIYLNKDKWRKVKLLFIPDNIGAQNAILAVFAWNQPDAWFEIRNFTLRAL